MFGKQILLVCTTLIIGCSIPINRANVVIIFYNGKSLNKEKVCADLPYF